MTGGAPESSCYDVSMPKHLTYAFLVSAPVGALAALLSLVNCSVSVTSDAPLYDGGADRQRPPGTPPDDGDDDPPITAPKPDSGKPDGGQGRTLYAVAKSATGNQLLKFSTLSPGDVTKVAITGLGNTNEIVQGLDFRPKTGGLYAFTSEVSAAALYTIDKASGAATKCNGTPAGTYYTAVLDSTSASWAVDFDPIEDRLRIIASNGQMYRLHPENGKSVTPTSPDPAGYSGGAVANFAGTAFTNSLTVTPAKSALYGIDATKNVLAVFQGVANPSLPLKEIGPLGVDPTEFAGFDIWGGTEKADAGPTLDKPLEAYAAMTVGTTTSLYKIDLATGAATSLGAIGIDVPIRGLTIEP
jgi:hypothetical protein